MEPTREQKDDKLIADAMAELDAYEKASGKTVTVHVDTSSAAGNCAPGVLAWRAKWVGGRADVPAREMLTAAAACRDQVSRVVLGVRHALKLAKQASPA